MSHSLAPRFAAGAAQPRPGTLSRLWNDIKRSWLAARSRARYADIDETTLRDVGLSRSELTSFEAEAQGLAEVTRLRVTRHHGASF